MKIPEPNLINKYPTPGHYTTEQMLAWGKATAEAEREACAKLVDYILKDGGGTYGDAIRARGNT
jgi:hypothetical protein